MDGILYGAADSRARYARVARLRQQILLHSIMQLQPSYTMQSVASAAPHDVGRGSCFQVLQLCLDPDELQYSLRTGIVAKTDLDDVQMHPRSCTGGARSHVA